MFRSYEFDLSLLKQFGQVLDRRSQRYGCSVRQLLISHLLRVRDKEGALVPLRPNRVQQEFDANHERRSVVLKARQLGMTTWIAARFFLDTITRPGTVTVQVAHDQESAEEIFRIVHRFLANLPEWLRNGALQTSRANVRQLVFPQLDSEYRVESAADANAGRGLTIRKLHCSEVARWPGDAAATLAALRAAVPHSGEIVLESTPNGAGGCFYDEWQRAAERGYTRQFFPWWWAKEYAVGGLRLTADGVRPAVEHTRAEREGTASAVPRTAAPHTVSSRAIATESDREAEDEGARGEGSCDSEGREPIADSFFTDDERALIRDHGLAAEQIAFRRELRATFGPLAPQEYAEDPESCFLASGECVFDIEIVQKRLAELCSAGSQPAGAHSFSQGTAESGSDRGQDAGATREVVQSRDNGRLLIFWPPRADASYVVGADPAGGGTGGDFSCAQVIERSTGMQCAELHGHFPPQEFAARLAELAREYHGALVAVERNNHGHAVLAQLANAERYENLYEQRGQSGWLTNVASRPAMLERFAALLRHAPQMFSSARLLRECRSFVRRDDGTPAAAPGAHDDTILAMAIALAVREEMAGAQRKESAVGFSSMGR